MIEKEASRVSSVVLVMKKFQIFYLRVEMEVCVEWTGWESVWSTVIDC